MPRKAAELTTYRRKRHFSRTPEPDGSAKAGRKHGHSFVIQKHAASRLHFDFRLELDGVLKSWAVPKGPSFDPREKRLAVQVEDHPLEYASFEGVIPAGEYGGGTVIVWDRGTWEPLGDPHEGLRTGKLKFRLDGERLHGGWTLVRIRSRGGDEKNWLLIKERDDSARSADEFDVVASEPTSIASGRTLERVAADGDRTWKSNRSKVSPAKRSTASATNGKSRQSQRRKAIAPEGASGSIAGISRLEGAKKGRVPQLVEVQLATLASAAPEGAQWLHEIKLDGYRLLCQIEGKDVRCYTRNQLDWTNRFPALVRAARQLPARAAVIDGEVVALGANGVSSFQELQNAFKESRSDELVYYAFDLLFLNGYDLRGVALKERKAVLSELLGGDTSSGRIRYTDHLAGDGPEFFAQCCGLGLEGIISKRGDRPYRRGRSPDWLKIKCVQREEFVIGGYTDPTASRKGLGALLVGYHDRGGRLVYAGRVGTGFSDQLLLGLRKRLDALKQNASPFANSPPQARGVHWARPDLVAQVEFGSRTRDGVLRHASFQGLREDKAAANVVHEDPLMTADVQPSPAKRKSPRAPQKKAAVKTAAAKPQTAEPAGVRLTHPDRVLYPGQGITKLGLAEYYQSIADWILPHVAGRPLSLVRCPQGSGTKCFFQKHAAAGTPDVLHRVPIVEKSQATEYLAVADVPGLVSLVQMGVLEIHPWGSRSEDVERPDRMILDLDPDESVSWTRVTQAAVLLRDRLDGLGLQSFVKTTGGKGLHVVVPIQRRHSWDEVKQFSKAVVESLAAESPQAYTTTMSKAARKGRIFLDYLRNDRGATAVAAYSTRAKPGATVSVPLAWDELSPAIRSDHFHVGNLPGRLAGLRRDPWHDFFSARQSLTAKARKKLGI